MSHRKTLKRPKDSIGIELARVFGAVKSDKDRHRISERVSKLNQLGHAHGVRLEVDEAGQRLLVGHAARQRLRRFSSKLSRGTGSVQRALAQALREKIAADPSHHAEKLAEFVNLQLQELPAWIAKPLQFALGVSIDSLFIDSPFTCGSPSGVQGPIQPSAYEFLRADLLRAKEFHGLVTGDPGSGKTTLLYKLFRELCRLYLAGEISSLPVFIPAGHAEIREGRLCWWMGELEPYLRRNPNLAESLRFLELSGKVIFLIDGLDENPDLVDFSRIEAVKAWQEILRSRCVLSCRSRFYAQQLEGDGLTGRLGGRWSMISLAEWRNAEAQSLYRRLAACAVTPPPEARVTSSELKRVFAHLGNLSKGEGAPSSFRKTPLNLWLYSLFVASNQGLFPRNEYELLEFVFNSICQWQAAKKGRIVPLKAMVGILTRMAWLSYSASQSRERRYVGYGEVGQLLEAHRPGLLPRKDQAITELESNPILECDPENGILWIDPHFMDFLAARQLIQTLILQDTPRAIEQFSRPVLWDVSRYFDEGVDLLLRGERPLLSAALIDAFKTCEQAFEKERTFPRALALNQIGYHLGRMGDPSGREFLHRVIKDHSPALEADICYWAIVIGLALSGDTAPLVRYVDGLEKNPERSLLNLAYGQAYFMDKKIPAGDLEAAMRELGPSWEKSCDAILAQLDSRHFRNIQWLDLFGLRRFLQELGPDPFFSERGPARQEKLEKIMRRLARESRDDRALSLQFQRLQKILSKTGLTGLPPARSALAHPFVSRKPQFFLGPLPR